MKKQEYQKIGIVTALVILFLAVTIFSCIQYADTYMTKYAFERLNEMAEDLAREQKEHIKNDHTILSAMASALAREDLDDTEGLLKVLSSYKHEKAYVSVQLLTKEEKLLKQDGSWSDVSDRVSFEEEVNAAPALSGRVEDFSRKDVPVVYLSVPVVQNEETMAVLYGVVDLELASKQYSINDFGGNAFVLLIDGATGDVLLDTWHASLGNLRDYRDRDFKLGDTVDESIQKMSMDKSGNLAFVSKTRGKMIYLHYEPVGVNHWSATIGITEEAALAKTQDIVNRLYVTAVLIFAALVLYGVIIVLFLIHVNRRIYQVGVTDQDTGLLNRSAYKAYLAKMRMTSFSEAACIYLDANGLHELNNQYGHAAGDAMLRAIAEALRMQWPDSKIYRIGGDEFVVFPQIPEPEICLSRIHRLHGILEEEHYSVSVGYAYLEKETGLDGVVAAADQDMLQKKAAYHAEHDGHNGVCRK